VIKNQTEKGRKDNETPSHKKKSKNGRIKRKKLLQKGNKREGTED
jgi:hypothetical protein